MNLTQQIINILLIIGLIVVISCVGTITYFLIQALKSIARLADSLEDTSQHLKDRLQSKALAAIPAVLVALAGKLFKRR